MKDKKLLWGYNKVHQLQGEDSMQKFLEATKYIDYNEEEMKEALCALIEEKDTELYEELIRKQEIKEPIFAEKALKQGIFCPATLYKDASPQVRDQLIALLEEGETDTFNVNGILLALATIGDDVVLKTFQKWEKNPLPWREKLNAGPARYALEGGWCIEDGRKKELLYDKCFAIQKCESCEKEKNLYGGLTEDRCPECGFKYEDILVLDGKDPRLDFLGIDGKIKIKTCKECILWEPYIFCKYEENGESKVICQENGEGTTTEDEDFYKESYFVISEEAVPKHHCSRWEGSAIGGVPEYVNDANYAECPECGKKMKHLAQLGEEYTGYGNIYVQICKECKIVATSYQQS